MAWPQPLIEILAQRDSPASQAVRWSLHGLRATLQAVIVELPQDPVSLPLRSLVAEMDPLLDEGSISRGAVFPTRASSGPKPVEPPVPPPHSAGLSALAQAVARDERFRAELERVSFPVDNADQVWGNVQRLLLRVPAHLAEEWRHRSQEFAEQAGGRLDEWAAVVLPLPWDEAIYPGVTGEIRAAGLRSASTAALDSRVPPASGDIRMLAGIVSACLWFLEHDPHLYHCLKNVFRFGVAPLSGEQRERYVAELLKLWSRVRAAANSEQVGTSRHQSKAFLYALLDLDEAFHSLVYQPPAAADSWWGRLLGQGRDALFRARDQAVRAGCAAHLQVLGGNFADINQLAPDSLQVDFGTPGEICTCLRVWARIDGEELKGRVLFRSPREAA
jgi:hypothetical protein